MENYIEGKVFGLPKPLRKGWNTSPTAKKEGSEYVHKVTIRGFKYFKVHLGRQGKSKIKYFKKLKDAKMFVELLRQNKYL
ncbi:MAG: hypothetical protein ACOYOV_00150 [Bacteroidales bacterium]